MSVSGVTKYLSVFSPNTGKCGPEYLRIRTLFTQYYVFAQISSYFNDPLISLSAATIYFLKMQNIRLLDLIETNKPRSYQNLTGIETLSSGFYKMGVTVMKMFH